MEKIDILLWVMSGGFALMLIMWNHLTRRIDDINTSLSKRIDDVGTKVSEIDKRLYGIETVLHMKDCCMMKQDQNLKKVE